MSFETMENINFTAPITTTSIMPRWQRKALQAQNGSPCKTPSGKRSNITPRPDRFIPSRSAMDLEVSHFNLTKEERVQTQSTTSDCEEESFETTLTRSLMDEATAKSDDNRVLAFKNKAPKAPEGYENNIKVLYVQNYDAFNKKSTRYIPQAAEKILDAPELLDDYYLNLMDWSSTNVLGIALAKSVYLWNASTGGISELMHTSDEDTYVTSLSWIGDGSHVAVGLSDSDVQLWDVENCKQVRSMKGHQARVSSLAWNSFVLSSGSRDSSIVNHDVRVQEHIISTMQGHSQEVCGLKWSPNGMQLASGGNDNVLNIWDAGRTAAPKFTLTHHQAAVKALAWCPWQDNLLATGGGTADRTMRFWNSHTGACLNSIDTKSQVCSLVWSKHEKEIVSSHGFSQNQLTVWKYPSLVKVAELNGHTARVLHMSMSPDGETIASAAADETLRFWKMSSAKPKPMKAKANNAAAFQGVMNIR